MPFSINKSGATPLSGDVTTRAHRFVQPCLWPGATVVDATCGAGHDTRFLARAIGQSGIVHAFDIQAEAIRRTRARLIAEALADRVYWHHQCHSRMAGALAGQRVAAVMFNLGWLPEGPRAIITRPATTCAALAQAAELLAPGGRLSIVAYRGHAGGIQEARAVAAWCEDGDHGLVRLHAEAASTHPLAPVFHGLARPMP